MATITYDVINPDGSRRTVTETVPPETVNQQTLQQQAQAALANNRTYIALSAPSTAQNTAQIKALSQQMQALIRMALGQFDATN